MPVMQGMRFQQQNNVSILKRCVTWKTSTKASFNFQESSSTKIFVQKLIIPFYWFFFFNIQIAKATNFDEVLKGWARETNKSYRAEDQEMNPRLKLPKRHTTIWTNLFANTLIRPNIRETFAISEQYWTEQWTE